MRTERKRAGRRYVFLIAAVFLAAASLPAGCGKDRVPDPREEEEISSVHTEPERKEDTGTSSAKTMLSEDLDADDGWFVWDLNGDGTPEEFSVERIANGDEAADVGIITRTGDGSSVFIDRFYGIEKIAGGEDENGRYLEITYYTGDFYEQGAGAKCILRDVNGELDIRRVSGKEPGSFFDFMDDYMSLKFYQNFDGEYFPVSVTDAAMGEPKYEITDKEAIRKIFEALQKVEIGGQTDNVLLDADRYLTFRFANGDRKIYLFYGDEQVYYEEFVYGITNAGDLFQALEEADRLASTTQSEGIGAGS